MGSRTGIAWTDATWNPVRGCSRVSEGCRFCYAEGIAARFSRPGQPFDGFAEHPAYSYGSPAACHRPARPTWTGRVELVPEKLDEPLHWRKPRRVFVNSMSDLFHERLSDGDIDEVFAVMALAQHHSFQVLTKRPERMRAYLSDSGVVRRWSEITKRHPRRPSWHGGLADSWFPRYATHVWLGASVEDQATADARIPILLDTPAAVRFVSYEPALEAVDFSRFVARDGDFGHCIVCGWRGSTFDCPTPGHGELRIGSLDRGLDWLIVGGESGPKARPFDVAWARSVVAQCKAAGVACFVKQLGANAVVPAGRLRHYEWSPAGFEATDPGRPSTEPWRVRLRDPAGADPSEWPEDLRVREFPGVARG